MDIDRYIVVSLEKIIINIDQCYGHRDDDHQETINEHIQLCTKYLKEIFKLKKLDSILKSFNISLGKGLSDEGKEMFNKLFFNTITFHDTGKINPVFQNDKMNNPVMNYLNPPKNLESDHSKLSAYIYLGHYLNKLKELKKRCPSVRCEHVFYNSDAHNLEAINEPVNQINKDDFYQLWRKI